MESSKSYRKAARLAQPGQWKKHGWISGQGERLISPPGHPDWLWGPPSLPSVDTQVLSPGVMHSTHLHLMLRLRMEGAIPSFSPHAFIGCIREKSNLTVIT